MPCKRLTQQEWDALNPKPTQGFNTQNECACCNCGPCHYSHMAPQSIVATGFAEPSINTTFTCNGCIDGFVSYVTNGWIIGKYDGAWYVSKSSNAIFMCHATTGDTEDVLPPKNEWTSCSSGNPAGFLSYEPC